MVDDRDGSGSPAEPAALRAALNAADASEEAREYLKKQSRLADLQMEQLRLQNESLAEQDSFEMSHLRWRRFNDQMKGALQIMLVAVGLLIVIGIGAALWNASEADGLVVDSFTAPPDFAARGMGGDALATDFTNRLAAIRDFANDNSLARSSDVRQDSSQDIKAEIPDTGVSLGEIWRYLRAWLGHERHVSGALYRLPDGNIELRAQLGGDVVSASGPPADLVVLEQKVAERIFARVDPINDVIYLWTTGSYAAAQKQAGENTLAASTPDVRADSYALWSETTQHIAGDVPRSIALAKVAIALDPKLAIAYLDLAESEQVLGHDEAALGDQRAVLARKEADQPNFLQGAGFASVRSTAEESASALLGDFASAEAGACGGSCMPANLDDAALYAALRHDASRARALMRTADVIGRSDAPLENRAQYEAAAATGDWAKALAAARPRPGIFVRVAHLVSGNYAVVDATQTKPLLARALARHGDFAKANAVIATTPRDCYDCVRARGLIDALQHRWGGAAYWFAVAVKQAPSIPFAYADWGAMLLAKGDLDGAIEKFAMANQKGPHFADPLEMWGEALIARNRSDLALAKFAEADKYAPNWGRLHLKWGEALWWSGDRQDARKQFAIASHLDLTTAENRALARMQRAAGAGTPPNRGTRT